MSLAAIPLPGKGTILQLKITSTFATIGRITKLDGPDSSLGIRDTTALDSTYKGKAPTIVDLGKISGTMLYDPNDTTTHSVIRGKLYAPPATIDEWKLIYNDGKTTPANDDVKGWLTKFKPTGMEVEGNLEADFEIDLSDSYTFTAGA